MGEVEEAERNIEGDTERKRDRVSTRDLQWRQPCLILIIFLSEFFVLVTLQWQL